MAVNNLTRGSKDSFDTLSHTQVPLTHTVTGCSLAGTDIGTHASCGAPPLQGTSPAHWACPPSPLCLPLTVPAHCCSHTPTPHPPQAHSHDTGRAGCTPSHWVPTPTHAWTGGTGGQHAEASDLWLAALKVRHEVQPQPHNVPVDEGSTQPSLQAVQHKVLAALLHTGGGGWKEKA